MKKRLIALLLVIALLIPAGIASADTWHRVNTNSLKVRGMPGENTQVLASYRRDYACNIISTKDGWAYVKFSNGYQGYVQSKYLKKGSSYKAWVSQDDTKLRSMPSGDGAVQATLAKGTRVTVHTHGSQYDYVTVPNFGSGYIRNSLLSKKQVKASGAESSSAGTTGGGYNAWIMSTGKVNLRNRPSQTAPVIAQYAPYTQVYVISKGATWSNIQVDGNTGWMMTKFLTDREPAPTATPNPDPGSGSGSSTYTAYVVSGNKKQVHVRKGNSTNYSVIFNVPYGAPVLVLKHDTKWDYIQYNGKKGYIDNGYLQLAKPADAGDIPTEDPSVTATPPQPFSPYPATVNINDLNFHKQMGDWSSNVDGVGRLQQGDQVTVLEIKGGWAKVEYNGFKGWVHRQYISP